VKRWLCIYFATVFLALTAAFPSRSTAATQFPAVAQIVHDGQHVTSALDITVRDLAGHARRGAQVGEPLDDVRVEVSSDDTVVVAAPNGHDALTLQPGSIAFFHYTGTQESVSVSSGKVDDEDTYGFFSHVTGQGGVVLTAPLDPVFSIEVSHTTVTVSSERGVVRTAILGSNLTGSRTAASLQATTAYLTRVDSVSPAGRSSMTYTLGQQTTANVSLADDEAAANKGDADAEFNLGAVYSEGNGVPQNYATAVHYYQLAAAQGNALGENNLGIMYQSGDGVPQDYASAARYFQLAAAQGNVWGENNLGTMYQGGVGVPQDYPTAVHYYQLAADQGNAFGESNLGYMYQHGLGVPQDYATAVHYFQLAAAQGNAFGEINLAATYEFGRGVPQNSATAGYYLQLAAAQGNAFGGYVGYGYEFGHGVPQNYATALHYYQLSAAQGNVVAAQAFAEAGLGRLYASGHGVPQNYATALHYFQLAAAQGNSFGEAGLGQLYEFGHGVPQNYATALHYFQLAAAQGNPFGESALGRLYEFGRGVAQDYVSALRYYQLAAAQGDADAKVGVQRVQRILNQQSSHP
jgi:TPR repeat protein